MPAPSTTTSNGRPPFWVASVQVLHTQRPDMSWEKAVCCTSTGGRAGSGESAGRTITPPLQQPCPGYEVALPGFASLLHSDGCVDAFCASTAVAAWKDTEVMRFPLLRWAWPGAHSLVSPCGHVRRRKATVVTVPNSSSAIAVVLPIPPAEDQVSNRRHSPPVPLGTCTRYLASLGMASQRPRSCTGSPPAAPSDLGWSRGDLNP